MSEQLSVFDAPAQRPIKTLPDVGRFHHNGTDTERAAAEAAPVGTQRERVLAVFRKVGDAGVIDEEGAVLAHIRFAHVFGTRREELIAAGVPIKDSGVRRQTTSRRLAIVWRLFSEEEDTSDHSCNQDSGDSPTSPGGRFGAGAFDA